MTTVTVEVADLAQASRTLSGSVADRLVEQVGDALEPLFGVGGMAGDDPAARHWAGDYDRAAPAAISAAEDVLNGCYRVSAMLAATARNYANAEAASTVRGHRPDPAVTAAITRLPDDTHVGLPAGVPSASAGAGSGHEPAGWHFVVHHLGGYVWPNGHQDRLRRAAAAWHDSAAALESSVDIASVVGLPPIVDRLPEGFDISTVCLGLGDHLAAVARAHRGLGRACGQLATHIDHAHSRVEHELAEFVAWTLSIQTVGAIASVCTLGVAEAPTQAAQLARIAATASKVVAILRDFAAAVKTLALTVGPIADAAADVRAAVAWLRELRIVEVEVSAVPGLRVYQIARVEASAGTAITATEMTGEVGAYSRLEQASLAAVRVARLRKLRQLERKFKHAGDFGVTASRGKEGFEEFEVAIDDFIANPSTITVQGTYRAQAAVLHYNPENAKIVIEDTTGHFISAWRMTPAQLARVEHKGEIGLGP